MPIRPPALDDRRFDDLVDEVLARIPGHAPEYTNPRLGDPGRTLIELFAWLTDTLLYRANLIPERQRLVFLRLLGLPMNPPAAARGLVRVDPDDDVLAPASLRAGTAVKGPVPFETVGELRVLPLSGQAYRKRPLTTAEQGDPAMPDVIAGLRQVYQLAKKPVPYVTAPVFPDGKPDPDGFDLVEGSVDRLLWVGLFAAKPEQARAAEGAVAGSVLNVGVLPALTVPALFEQVGPRARVPHVWELTTGREVGGEPEYVPLEVIADGTDGLTRRGVVRLALPPGDERIGAPPNDVRTDLAAGVGARPPRLDDPDRAARLVAWLRLRPTIKVSRLALSWVGVNAVEVDQRQTVTGTVVGVSDGTPEQEFRLPAAGVQVESFVLQVDEPGYGYRTWRRTDDLATAGRDDPVYVLDPEAGTVRFGDGLRGRVPDPQRRVRVAVMRAGGGAAGNLPPGSLADLSDPRDPAGNALGRRLKVTQETATDGGADGETLAEAERRIPARLRHGDRAVTADDFRKLAAETPGVRVGRAEVLPLFLPQQRRQGVAGVVTAMVLPYKDGQFPPNPRPDRPFLEAVDAYLQGRRLVGTELYTVGCEYVPVGVAVAVGPADGFGFDAVTQAVRAALRQYLWPLAPGGPQGSGWPLGRAVNDRELEVVVSRVPGVDVVAPLNLFTRDGQDWRPVPRGTTCGPAELALEAWQLPELRAVVVAAGTDSPADLRGADDPFADPGEVGVAVPVVPEVC
jgi:predicted phage baseplate assembly protein